MSRQTVRFAVVLALLTMTLAPAMGYSDGPPTEEGDQLVVQAGCTCHGDNKPSSDLLMKVSGVPHAYEPGVAYTMTLELADPTNTEGGFMLSSGGDGVFSWDAAELIRPEKDSGESASETTTTSAISHKESKDPMTWTFTWTAPADDVGGITFWVAGNAVDGSQAPDAGDNWNTLSFVINAPSETSAQADQSTRVISVGDYESLFVSEVTPEQLEAERQTALSHTVMDAGALWWVTTLVALIVGGVFQREMMDRKLGIRPAHLDKQLAYPQGIRRGVLALGMFTVGMVWQTGGQSWPLIVFAYFCAAWAAYGVYRTVYAAKTPPTAADIM